MPRPGELSRPFLSLGTPWEAPRSCASSFSLSASLRAPLIPKELQCFFCLPACFRSWFSRRPRPPAPRPMPGPRLGAGAGHTVSIEIETERERGDGLVNVHVTRKWHMLQQGSIPEGSPEEVTFKLCLGSCK